jgi:hypothetical protein
VSTECGVIAGVLLPTIVALSRGIESLLFPTLAVRGGTGSRIVIAGLLPLGAPWLIVAMCIGSDIVVGLIPP